MTERKIVVSRPSRGRAGVTDKEIEQEASWRLWFPKSDWPREMSEEEARRLTEGFKGFAAQVKIKHPSRGRIPFILRAAQEETVYQWIKNPRVVNLKARQIGFSTLAAVFMLWVAMGWPDKHMIALSKGERESIKLLGKSKLAYNSLPRWVQTRGPKIIDRAKQVMTFDNESVVESLPSASDPARGESVFLVVVDEWAFLNNPDEAWASIEPIADIGGRIVGISTANGEGNFFHRLWIGAVTNRNGFQSVFWPWSAVEERDDAWYEDKRDQLPLWQLCQEYPRNPEEAFVGSGNPVFNLDILGKMETFEPLRSMGIELSHGTVVREFPEGDLHIFQEPEDEAMYAIGCDTAQGLKHGDFTVAVVLDVESWDVVAVFRSSVDPDVMGEKILPAIGHFYNYAVVAPEINNHGLTTLKGLQRSNYGRIYRRRAHAKRVDEPGETLGWLTTQTSKPLLVDELAAWLRTHNVPYQPMLGELKTYVRDKNGRMSGSPHDDCVIALGIAVQAVKYCHLNKHRGQLAVDVPGSIDWWDRRLSAARSAEDRRMSPSMSRSRHAVTRIPITGRSWNL